MSEGLKKETQEDEVQIDGNSPLRTSFIVASHNKFAFAKEYNDSNFGISSSRGKLKVIL